MQDFYRCEPGYEELADQVARQACIKLVKDLYYEARIQAVIDYNAEQNVQVKKAEARTMILSREQYMDVRTCDIDVSYVLYLVLVILVVLCLILDYV